MRWWRWGWILGISLILIGLFLPLEWYDSLPRNTDLPVPPISGARLLQISFVLEGLALIWLSLRFWSFTRLSQVQRLRVQTKSEERDLVSKSSASWLLAAITLLGLILRLLHIDSDLWLDEISPILDYGEMSVVQVMASYLGSNNHLLNTLLVKLAVACFGEQEWTIRLPAVIFGTATIPALYWVARLVFSRTSSLSAALLLAVSYHHIFFSQNARGYTAYLLFSILSSRLLCIGLQEDRARIWALYILTMVLNFASQLISAFLFASHTLVGLLALLVVWRRGVSPIPLLRRLTGVFAVTAFVVFQLYAMILPQAYVYMQTVYVDPVAGYSILSEEFLRELVRGLAGALGSGGQGWVLPVLLLGGAVAGMGFIGLLRRHWPLTIALTVPGILSAIFVVLKGLAVSPRFFLLTLPLAFLVGVQGLYSFTKLIASWLGKQDKIFPLGVSTALVLVASAFSLPLLRYYYAVPKQAYAASIQYLQGEREPGDIVIVIYLAEKGYRYYGTRFGLEEGKDCFFVRSEEAFDAVLNSHSERRTFLVTTFPRALRLSYPSLNERIQRDWKVDRTFPATIGDGEISVWKPR